MIIPLKYQQYDNDLRSIRMDHKKYGSCIVCFCDFKEVEELIHEGWKILNDQKTRLLMIG